MMGVVGGNGILARFDGDASLRKRPMRRILDPLVLMGAEVRAEGEGGRCPILLQGTHEPAPIEYRTPVASAQIKSAILLAALNSAGRTTIIEREASRDHTEKMLAYFGADIASQAEGEAGRRISLKGRPELVPAPIVVPADPSSAAFPLVAALIVPGSDVLIEGVMLNPLRTGLVTTLLEMGAQIQVLDRRSEGGEEVADLRVCAGPMRGVDVPASRAPSMIDEYPILAIAAAFAHGDTHMRGLCRAAGEGIGSPRRRRRGPRGERRSVRNARRRSHCEGRGRSGARQRPRCHPPRSSHRNELSCHGVSGRTRRCDRRRAHDRDELSRLSGR